MIGKRVGGRYEILSRLGEGGMAIVYKAKDLILDRIVAVKVLRSELAGDDEFIRRFRREAESVASLSHPNIVAIYDIGEEEDCYYLVMEYVQGMTLKEFIKDYSPIPINEAVHIMKQITKAIAHAHALGIVHRDIKPHNIMIDETEHIEVTDFGIAVTLTGATITYTHSIIGSAHYLSPEQARGGKATVKSDIYALGIVMFELLTGRLPFPGTSAVSVALKHLREPMPYPRNFRPEIPQSLENVMIRALEKNPDDRYAGVDEMFEDLSTALNPERADEERLSFREEQDHFPEDDPDEEQTIKIPPILNGNKEEAADQSKPEIKTNPPEKKKKNRAAKWLTYMGIVFLLMTAGLVIGLYVLPKLFYVENVRVPDVSGKNYNQAERILKGNQLKVNRVNRSSETVRKEQVIRQNPEADAEVKANTEIDLYVSSGPKTEKMGNYVGYSRDALEESLKDEGYKDIVWDEEASSSVPEGEVIRQIPAAGKNVVPSDTVVELTVSTGTPQVTIPDLTGKTKDEAYNLLQKEGLSADFVAGDFSNEIEKGLVLEQDPAPGRTVAKGSTVIISLSMGSETKPKEVDQPIKVVYPSKNDHSGDGPSDNADQPIHVQIYYTDANHDNALYADEEITETKAYHIPFTINPDEQGTYRVLIDGSVKKEGTVDYPED
ncbi:Stk1 family PASTA domain-containing Ser/Thr kinase [Sporolactobacillus sp. THM7-7]|nr:Stk1 family PASTA domain-containing Ser/Thr kinase [Sporolactobacillus sp. THM7-7]